MMLSLTFRVVALPVRLVLFVTVFPALLELDAELRPALKKAGFLTRDPREKERRNSGLKSS